MLRVCIVSVKPKCKHALRVNRVDNCTSKCRDVFLYLLLFIYLFTYLSFSTYYLIFLLHIPLIYNSIDRINPKIPYTLEKSNSHSADNYSD